MSPPAPLQPGQLQSTFGQDRSKWVEKEFYAIIPSSSLFRDVLQTVLLRLGFTAEDVSNAKGKSITTGNLHLFLQFLVFMLFRVVCTYNALDFLTS